MLIKSSHTKYQIKTGVTNYLAVIHSIIMSYWLTYSGIVALPRSKVTCVVTGIRINLLISITSQSSFEFWLGIHYADVLCKSISVLVTKKKKYVQTMCCIKGKSLEH